MDAKPARAFQPDYAIPPGETLLETIESLGIAQSELAERTGRPKKTINEIVNGKAAITPETALQFERVLGVSASFWSGLEQNYRAALASIAERERLEHQIGWLKEIPAKQLVKAGWVPPRDNAVEQLESLLSFFGVASVDAWRGVWDGVKGAVAFRQSKTFESDFGTVAAWLRKGEIEGRGIKCRSFDARRFKAALFDARTLTREDPQVFCEALANSCAAAGVAVLFVPELPKLRVCGATRWLTPDKAMIQLTLRYKTDDHLWFTFFHEAGHILLHGKRSVFVEEIGGVAKVVEHKERTPAPVTQMDEEEANRFARDMLIPPEQYKHFLGTRDFSTAAIRHFAGNVGIAPGIVVGRLQHDGKLPFPTSLNKLKRRFQWIAE